ncbi:MAG: phospholipase D-like domain-containing protein [Gordonia sp. (in: high G+C Gram-positive bacteria)]
MNEPLASGLYESICSQRLQAAIERTSLSPEFSKLDADDAPEVLARHVADSVRRHLRAIKDPAARFAAVNDILSSLPDAVDETLVPSEKPLLSSLHDPERPVLPRPATPLSDVALLTNTPDEPNMASEIARELASADRVDLLCAFIRFAGVAVLSRELMSLRDRGVPLRVVTTTYRGATERRAVDDLVNKYGAEVRIRYETASTRLHAKAWLFRRNTGFDTGYVGSSNLSRSAMVDGLEWNVRISGVATPTLTRKWLFGFQSALMRSASWPECSSDRKM